MNVLMFTMTMLLLIATMTYAKLTSLKMLHFSKIQFEQYIEQNERTFLNEEAKVKYDNTHITAHESTLPRQPKTGTSKLSLAILFDADEREKDPSKLKDVIDLSKKLILNLYSKEIAIQKHLETSPDILDRFFLSLMKEFDKRNEKIKTIEELASIDFHDEALNEFSYELFKTHTGTKDYSFLDHLTLQKQKTRLFLASKELLQAIFNQNSSIVSEVLEKRELLYKQAKKDKKNEAASAEFKEFMTNLSPYLNPNLFDLSVTRTNPKNYE